MTPITRLYLQKLIRSLKLLIGSKADGTEEEGMANMCVQTIRPSKTVRNIQRAIVSKPQATIPFLAIRTDEQLMDQYQAGDQAAFAELMQRYQNEVYHLLFRFLGNRAAAEDAFQDTFLQVHRSTESFDRNRNFRPWLFAIASNKARDLLRMQSRRPMTSYDAPLGGTGDRQAQFIDLFAANVEAPDGRMEKDETRQKVRKIIDQMPEHLRQMIMLAYFHRFTYEQIAEMLKIPLGTVKSRLHTAVAHFARRWHQLVERRVSRCA